ncbi:Probable transcriptional regulatory protein NarL [Chromobacterium violaceum]|uniref:Probable transcriptional regulatory protein NarL n=1 Tax=Chromobacterium violaceum TaxID=536 RepID=A0A447TA35_CHRVL|nr:Probable transcriptional regulatory protein NarL [Chromobacterium violaceum]
MDQGIPGGRSVIRVGVVDDQALVRSGVRGLLELTGDIQVVLEAADGAEALERLAGVQPDVLLLDVRMPGMSGIDLLRALNDRDACRPPSC